MTTQQILDQIDEATSPEEMTKQEALEFMGEIIDDLATRCEALEMEIKDEN